MHQLQHWCRKPQQRVKGTNMHKMQAQVLFPLHNLFSQLNKRYKYNTLSTISLHRQKDLDTHILPGLHEFAVDDDLISANPVALSVGRVGSLCNLDFSPLSVGGHLR